MQAFCKSYSLGQKLAVIVSELGKFSRIKSIAYFLHQLVVEMQVVDNHKPESQRLLSFQQVADIGP